MKTVLIAPREYIQGRGVLNELGDYLKMLGKKPLVLWGPHVKEIVSDSVQKSIQKAGLEMVDVVFQGEATTEERARVAQIAREAQADVTVGIGGGKVLDVAKAVAVDAETKMVSCPTIASNDSPISGASVWYDAQHNFTGFDCWPFNPDIVLVDTQVIANGPVRAFVAGMGIFSPVGVVYGQINNADKHFEQKEYSKAIPLYEKALEKKEDRQAIINLGHSYYKIGRASCRERV